MTSNDIKQLALQLGFQDCKISDCNLSTAHEDYQQWLNKNFHAGMGYMQRNIDKRLNPEKLVPNTVSIITVRMDYLPYEKNNPIDLLNQPDKAIISRYALGRDYHKVIRKRLQKLATQIQQQTDLTDYRVFTDSAPILEKQIAQKSGIGWRGKHSNILTREGSWFFLGEIYTDIPLTPDLPIAQHCGSCSSCIDVCPTQAIVEPYVVDANKCISYLTIEHFGFIEEQYHHAIGNRIYGCDDCQLFCPWNKYAKPTVEQDFDIRHSLDDIDLLQCFNWTEEEFLNNMEGSPIRRIGYDRWIRNIAIALGNAPYSDQIETALSLKLKTTKDWLNLQIEFALAKHRKST